MLVGVGWLEAIGYPADSAECSMWSIARCLWCDGARAAQHSAVSEERCLAEELLFCFVLCLLQPVLLRTTISNNCICSHAEDNSRLGSSGAITEISSQPNISYPYFMDSSTCGASHHRPNRRKVNGGNFGHGVIPGHNSLFRNKRKIRIYFT